MPLTEDQEDALAGRAIEAFEHAGYPTMNDEQRAIFNSSIMVMCTEFMRKLKGDEWVKGFYLDAIKSLAQPVEIEAKHMDLQ